MDTQKWASNPPRRKIRAAVIPLLLLAVAIPAGVRVCWPGLFSRGLTGHLLNAAAVPGPGGGHRIWLLSDGSFQYIERIQTPGRVSVARKCRFCKTWTFVYDPIRKSVLAKFKTAYRTIITRSWMAYVNGKIWVATDAYESNPPRLFTYSVEPAGLVRETPEIIKTYPELSPGLIKVRMEKDPERFILDTKDGRVGLVLALSDEKIYANETEFRKATAADDADRVTLLALGREDSGPRKILFRVTGPRALVQDSGLEFLLGNLPSSPTVQTTAEPLSPGCVYIEGMIFYQDAEGGLILHQDAAGQLAHRLLTRLDADGREKWTAGPDQLFKEMNLDRDKNPLSDIFFLKDRVGISRSGSLILVQQKGVGVIGFDWVTGKKLWEIRL